ncbi:DUF383 domain-containing protein [archaeon]|nr:MAG: DUF383 domain-containing protein [archaeon]
MHSWLQNLTICCVIQVRSQHIVRRRGAAATLKNCLFDTNFHHWVVCELDVLTTLCLPLVVATPFSDKVRDFGYFCGYRLLC